MKKSQSVKELTFLSLFIAIIITMAMVPSLGFITIGPVSFTIIHIPVLIVAFLFNKKMGVIAGLTFGLSSMAVAFLRPTTPFDMVFQNPLVSVLPRMLFPLVAYYLASKIKFSKDNKVKIAIASGVATFAHTCMVLIPFYYFGRDLFDSNMIANLLTGILTMNSLVEITLAAILVPLIAIPLKKQLKF